MSSSIFRAKRDFGADSPEYFSAHLVCFEKDLIELVSRDYVDHADVDALRLTIASCKRQIADAEAHRSEQLKDSTFWKLYFDSGAVLCGF